MRWRARHFGFIQGEQFCDELVSGPFATWRHTHRIEAIGQSQSAYEDRVECTLPGGALVNRLGAPILRALLTRMFSNGVTRWSATEWVDRNEAARGGLILQFPCNSPETQPRAAR